jgi:hypothetical protein
MVPKAAKTVAASFNLINFIQFSPIIKYKVAKVQNCESMFHMQ